MTTQQERKEQALKLMKQLDIFQPYIDGFNEENKVCFYENFGGFWIDQEPSAYKKLKQLEEEYGYTVYAITHESCSFGECYDFLFVSKYKEDWRYSLEKVGPKQYFAQAYTWNKSDDSCSEFGTICVASFGGGIKRIG